MTTIPPQEDQIENDPPTSTTDDGFQTGFVELSSFRNANKVEPPPKKDPVEDPDEESFSEQDPVQVTTVESTETAARRNLVQKADARLAVGVEIAALKRPVRAAMTLLLLLMLPAVLLTVLSNPQYAVVVLFFWMVVFTLLAGLVLLIRSIILRDERILHPVLQAVADRVVEEINHFQEDWRHEILMIENGPVMEEEEEEQLEASFDYHRTPTPDFEPTPDLAEASASSESRRSPSPVVNEDPTPECRDGPPTVPAEEPREVPTGTPSKRRRPKSAIFRAVVQPFLPLVRRKKNRKYRHKKSHQETTSQYVPPEETMV